MKILFMGTGNLFPGSAVWSSLASHELKFAELNEWSQILVVPNDLDKEIELVVWVVCLEDLVPKALNPIERDIFSDREIERQLGPLKTFCQEPEKTDIIVAWSYGESYSSIQSARCKPRIEMVNSAWENHLRNLQKDHERLFLLPLYPQFASKGLTRCYDKRNYYAGFCRFSFQGLKVIAKNVACIAQRLEEASKKVLVLDCDGTLWGGVVGEDGIEGIKIGDDGIGKGFQDFQESVLLLAKQGILLAICSKNNEDDVWEVFEKHPEMRLTRDDIVAYRINWQEKADNIREIADELGLALNSIVFWDDSILEREKVRAYLPDVMVPEIPKEVWEWETILLDLVEFHKFTVTNEDRQKQSQYRGRADFNSERTKSTDLSEFMRSLGLQPSMIPISPPLLGRSEQLCAKTNQFNLSLRRHDSGSLKEMSQDPRCTASLVHLRDRFGDHGNVGLFIGLLYPENDLAFLDTFLMSCRILGRYLEAWMLQRLCSSVTASGIQHLVAEYIPAPRNQMVLDFLKLYGFEEIDPAKSIGGKNLSDFKTTPESILYSLDLENMTIPNLEYYNNED